MDSRNFPRSELPPLLWAVAIAAVAGAILVYLMPYKYW
jgi:glycerol uptake facilitator-like aquaporin